MKSSRRQQFSSLITLLFVFVQCLSQAKEGIKIAAPPAPQEILPPKPIIIAPMMVRQHKRRIRVVNYRTGNPPDPFNMPSPFFPGFPAYPNPPALLRTKRLLRTGAIPPMPFPFYQPPFQPPGATRKGRKLGRGQQIFFQSTSFDIPEISKVIQHSGDDLLPDNEREYDNGEGEVRSQVFKSSLYELNKLLEQVQETTRNFDQLQTELKSGYSHLSDRIERIQLLKNKAHRHGLV